MSNPAAPLPVRIRMGLRRFGAIHKPLKWFNQVARPAGKEFFLEILRRVFSVFAWIGPAKGWYSEYELVKERAIEGRIILTDQGAPKLPEPSIILLCKRGQHEEQPWPIFWSHRKNVRLAGASLVHLNEKKEICAEATYGAGRARIDPAYEYFIRQKPLKLDGPWTSVVSRWFPIGSNPPYAHWLLDALPRLALLKEFPRETRILLPEPKARYQVETMELLGLADRCRWTAEKHLLIEDYYFSAPTSMIVCYNPYAVNFLRATFLPLVGQPITPKRFFLRRTTYTRNMTNEDEVLRFFENLGWTIVDPGAMKFAQQIELFRNAEAVCAIHGSATANMVWCSPGCKFVELFADSYLAGDQEWIAQCVGVEYSFLIFPSDHKLCAQIDLPRVKSHLERVGAV